MRIIDIERDAIYMKRKSDKTFHVINPCGIKRSVFSPSEKKGRKPCKKCASHEGGCWVFHFEDGSKIDVGNGNIECSCTSGTVDCQHLTFLFNKVLKLREVGESLYDYGDLEDDAWATVNHNLQNVFNSKSTSTCSVCFEELNGINNIEDCNHVHKECLKIAKRCYRC